MASGLYNIMKNSIDLITPILNNLNNDEKYKNLKNFMNEYVNELMKENKQELIENYFSILNQLLI